MTPLGIATFACLALGLLLVLRAVAIVVSNGEGRFRFDAFLTTVLGFALMLLGVALIT